MNMTVLNNVKRFARLRGYSLTRVANLAGLSDNALYNWKNTPPAPASLKAVASVLGVSVATLEGETQPTPSEAVAGLDLQRALLDGAPLYWGRRELDEIDRAALSRLLSR